MPTACKSRRRAWCCDDLAACVAFASASQAVAPAANRLSPSDARSNFNASFVVRSLRHRLVLLALLFGVCSARAEPLVFVPSNALANDMLTSMLAEEVLRDATGNSKSRASRSRNFETQLGNSLSLGEPRMPQKLAASYPADRRAEAQRLFSTLLQKYRGEMEPKLGIPRNDLAGAVAAFLAGNYMAYRNVDFPDEYFKPLMVQMRQIITSNAAFAKASNSEKQEMYEQMAILGMLMASTQMALQQKSHPQAAASTRQAAKGYLEQFLKTDADRVRITAQGLALN
jgi:hypothetical protein